MYLEITIVGISLAGQQRFQLFLLASRADTLERGLGLGDDILLALGLSHLDKVQGLVEFLGEAIYIGDGFFKLGALPQQFLSALLIVPEIRVAGERVQLLQT